MRWKEDSNIDNFMFRFRHVEGKIEGKFEQIWKDENLESLGIFWLTISLKFFSIKGELQWTKSKILLLSSPLIL